MPRSALLLMDLQHDFLDPQGRMPVDRDGATKIIEAVNRLAAGVAAGDFLPIVVCNEFPASARIGNFFRNGAAIAGSAGAQVDARLHALAGAKLITKSRPDAFSNPELDHFLNTKRVQDIVVLGVFAEGCVRATVSSAIRHGYDVHVIADAVASNRAWKKRFALWAMKRAGARIVTLDNDNIVDLQNCE